MRATSESLREAYQVNLTNRQAALREAQLIAGYSDADAARKLLVPLATYRRWRSDRRPNPTAVRLLAIHAGYMPWRGWHGWEVHGGLLFPPGSRHGLEAAQVEALPFLLALSRDQRRTNAAEKPEEATQRPLSPWWRRVVGHWR